MTSHLYRHDTPERRGTSVQTHHVHYDPVCGYLHKFRLDGSQDVEQLDDATVERRSEDLHLLVASVIAVGVLLVIGALTL
jgi:hypothetical protein